jgi:hypothetical protein
MSYVCDAVRGFEVPFDTLFDDLIILAESFS